MAMTQDRRVMRQLGTLFTVGTGGGLTDGQLLERFATSRDDAAEQAFAALVERHGPMVLRVCRGVLADPHDAEDAFQATFMVLVRKACGLWVEDSLGPWLHQVAPADRLLCPLGGSAPGQARASRRQGGHRGKPHTRRRPRPAAPRGDRPAAGAIPRAGRALRPGGPHPRAGGAAPGLARRHGQEPAQPGAGTAPRPAHAARAIPERIAPRHAPAGRPRGAAPHPPRLVHDERSHPVRCVSDHPRRGNRRPCPGSPHGHVHDPMVESRVLVARRRYDGLRCRVDRRQALLGRGARRPGAGEARHRGRPVHAGRTGPSRHVPCRRLPAGFAGGVEVADVVSPVECPRRSSLCVPEGTRVKKGDLVGELDSASLRDQLTNQRIATRVAQANYRECQAGTRDRRDRGQGVSGRDLSLGQGRDPGRDQAGGDGDGESPGETGATQRSAREDAHAPQLPVTRGEILAEVDLDDRADSAEQAPDARELSLEKAQSKLNVLDNYRKARTLLELRTEVERKRVRRTGQAAAV